MIHFIEGVLPLLEICKVKIPKIYIDTSVVGGCFDSEFSEESRLLFEMARNGKSVLMVSDLLFAELLNAPPHVRAELASMPDACLENTLTIQETKRIRDCYLEEGIVGKSSSGDAHHVAVATVYKADMIVSWNFKHIVHYEKIRNFNAVNLREGYGSIEIYSPKEIV